MAKSISSLNWVYIAIIVLLFIILVLFLNKPKHIESFCPDGQQEKIDEQGVYCE